MPKIFNLSVFNFVPDAHRDKVNAIAEIYGCGPNNLSVKLVNANGEVFYGCHSWWNPDDYAAFSDPDIRAQIVPADLLPSLEFLHERLVMDGDAQENWHAALAENGLSIVEADQPV